MTHRRPVPIDRQVVVLTGATSGIGLAAARLLASKGAALMLVARNEAALGQVAADIRAAGGAADHAAADVGDRAAMEAVARQAVQRFGRIDTWVNNAGVAIYARLADTPDDEHERLFRTNYFGVRNGSLVALSHMRERGGTIINMGTIGSEVPSAILGAYTASKHAMRAFTEALRQELIMDGVPVTVALLLPGGVATPLAEHAAVHAEGDALIPRPTYDPQVVAEAILDAACHSRGNVHVGGQGLFTVAATRLLPGLNDRIGKTTARTLLDQGKWVDRPGDLFHPGEGGRQRSLSQSGRIGSLHAAARCHPIPLGLALGAIGGFAAWKILKNKT
ncbi:SDR family NAD(P)-dependent oxidoreductase [Salipiger sp. IMCC34102]|uniref:SDR family oxidoreductase n=1 Tax=Salipiger sp. IMCC34102 TaxID=2510647 RepID=UPI00101BF49B|nr:SDR family oxidoreductase [Salipiger sp. IMCC34102]RYH01593.1 SDR family NAD(P)-dependent oxidoreductase [Salipiger sp. IMCC34102]